MISESTFLKPPSSNLENLIVLDMTLSELIYKYIYQIDIQIDVYIQTYIKSRLSHHYSVSAQNQCVFLLQKPFVQSNSIGIDFTSVQEQYVFLHQAVMEALVCGNTEIIPQDLRIVMNKLSMVHKPSKKTGYEREFKVTSNYF